ncbi:7674_t:CDS:1 [Ambispora gerdemannii]|uniref:7674_t:CDS:1 n=1 Tax=Ambispora gerdemannii TaxID=144530 RepID=A0A9N8VAW3_9GLOM|nr:7674_t:CDS:1 [Ambispora gerdemannii]
MNTFIDDEQIDENHLDIQRIFPTLNRSINELITPKRRNPPPRPKNSWLLYRINHQPGPLEDISKKASESWKKEPEQIKRGWELLSKMAKQKHAEMYPNYVYRPKRSNQNRKSAPQKRSKKFDDDYKKHIGVFPLKDHTTTISSDEQHIVQNEQHIVQKTYNLERNQDFATSEFIVMNNHPMYQQASEFIVVNNHPIYQFMHNHPMHQQISETVILEDFNGYTISSNDLISTFNETPENHSLGFNDQNVSSPNQIFYEPPFVALSLPSTDNMTYFPDDSTSSQRIVEVSAEIQSMKKII